MKFCNRPNITKQAITDTQASIFLPLQ